MRSLHRRALLSSAASTTLRIWVRRGTCRYERPVVLSRKVVDRLSARRLRTNSTADASLRQHHWIHAVCGRLRALLEDTESADAVHLRSVNRSSFRTHAQGTDEYGTTTETRAMADGVTPQERARAEARTPLTWQSATSTTGSTRTRTTGLSSASTTLAAPRLQNRPSASGRRRTIAYARRICQDAFQRIYDNGYLEEKSTMQLYCETDKRCATRVDRATDHAASWPTASSRAPAPNAATMCAELSHDAH